MAYNDDINNPNYSIISAYNFFIGGDYVRVIILFYILFCFILNVLIIIEIIKSKKNYHLFKKLL